MERKQAHLCKERVMDCGFVFCQGHYPTFFFFILFLMLLGKNDCVRFIEQNKINPINRYTCTKTSEYRG